MSHGSIEPLQPPFPWFGSKRSIAQAIWERFGDVPNYVEPFLGSAAVMLARPHKPRTETGNDLDGFLVNFWRSSSIDPDAVAHAADWPVSECDLHARHAYLVKRIPWLTERLMGDPSFCDPKLAGWWLWGACCWIGTGWCSGKGPWVEQGGRLMLSEEASRLPHLGDAGRGIHRQLPHLGSAGRGIHRQLPHLGDAGRGIHRQLPHLGSAGREDGWTSRGAALRATVFDLHERLRSVRFACGDWRRVLTPVVTERHGTTAVFMDPPYTEGDMEYAAGGGDVAKEVASWARENGDNPLLRIALCGHEGEHDMPGWEVFRWKARGGYGNQGGKDADDNRHRETIWFSPHCLGAEQGRLF